MKVFDFGIYILLFYVIVVTIATIGLVFSVPIQGFYIILGFVITSCVVFIHYRKNNKGALWLVIVLLLTIVVCTVISVIFFDTSWDGNTYRKTSVYLLVSGWNPINETFAEAAYRVGTLLQTNFHFWYDTYPRGDFLFAASFYALFGNIETGKVFNPLFMIALVCITYTILKDLFELSKKQGLVCALVLAINPISLAQMTTFYNDIALGNMIFIFVLALLYLIIKPNGEYSKRCYFLIFLTLIIGFNLKLSAPLFFAIFMFPFYVYKITKYWIGRKIQQIIKLTAYFIFCVFYAFGFFTSYVTNLIRFGNPIYGMFDEEMTTVFNENIPIALRELPLWQQFFRSLFAPMGQVNYGNTLKIPFSISFANREHEFMFAPSPDIRIAGWGVFFSGIFIISLIVIGVYLFKCHKKATLPLCENNFLAYKKATSSLCGGLGAAPPLSDGNCESNFLANKNKHFCIVVSLLFLVLVPIFFVPHLFWARYYPHLFILPVIALIILFKGAKNKIITMLVILLLLNAIPQMVSSTVIKLGQSIEIRQGFREFNEKAEGRTALVQTVQFNDFFNGVLINMRDAGINNFIFYYYDFPYEFEGFLFVGFATLGYVFLPN